MIDELYRSSQFLGAENVRNGEPEYTFARSRYRIERYQELTLGGGRERRTLSVYPQERSGRFPLIKYTSLEKPFSWTGVMNFACVVMVGRWIWGR